MFSEIYIFLAPLTIYIYLMMVGQNDSKNVSNNDKLNIKLYSLPICGWNLTHVFIFYLLCAFLEPKIKNKKIAHLLIFTIGILWYIVEPIIYKHKAIHQKETKDPSKVYKNVYVPRFDDIVFNTAGQMLYMSVKYLS